LKAKLLKTFKIAYLKSWNEKLERFFVVATLYPVVMMVGIEPMGITDPNLGFWFTSL